MKEGEEGEGRGRRRDMKEGEEERTFFSELSG